MYHTGQDMNSDNQCCERIRGEESAQSRQSLSFFLFSFFFISLLVCLLCFSGAWFCHLHEGDKCGCHPVPRPLCQGKALAGVRFLLLMLCSGPAMTPPWLMEHTMASTKIKGFCQPMVQKALSTTRITLLSAAFRCQRATGWTVLGGTLAHRGLKEEEGKFQRMV